MLICVVMWYQLLLFFCKQKTAYEMRISDWSSDVCSSDLRTGVPIQEVTERADVGIGTFYNHFDSKDALFAAAIESALGQWAEPLDAVDDGTTDPEIGRASCRERV